MRRPSDFATEKQIERMGDELMALLGFTPVRFSQPRKTMQTRGIPDRRYYSAQRQAVLWWEAKSEKGKQSEDQKKFQAMCEAVGETYLVGTDDVLIAYARQRGWIK